jgi:hypothetical protein
MASIITWYSTDRNLAAVDRGAVGKKEAMEVIDGYFARLKPHYQSAEDSLAETMFGFQKSKEEFVEICVNGPTEVAFKYEVQSPRTILFLNLPKIFQQEATLHSKEEVQSSVALFYDLDSASYKTHVAR